MTKASAMPVENVPVENDSAVAAMGRAAMGIVEGEGEAGPLKGLAARLSRKKQFLEVAKDRIGAAIALEKAGNSAASAVSEAQGEVINLLCQGTLDGLLDKAQVSALLGDSYGYRPKADGSPGKTPEGAGQSIRKRIVTLVEATQYVNGAIPEADKPRWLAGKTPEEVAPIVNQWAAGDESPWQAYKSLTEREKTATVTLPFDHAKLLKLVEALGDDANLERIADNPALIAAYDAICEAWQAVRGE